MTNKDDDFSIQPMAYTNNAYSSPSSGSLESIMGNTNSESSSPTPPPSHDERNVSRYMENLRYGWCFSRETTMPATNSPSRTHKISPSFDVFCTDRLCSRRQAKTPDKNLKHGEICCGLGAWQIAALSLIGTAQLFLIITTIYAIVYCFRHAGNWDIGGVIAGVTAVYTFFAGAFLYGMLKYRLKFLLPLTFQTFLVLIAGSGAFMVVLFTSLGDKKISDTELAAHITFCFLLGIAVCHQLTLFIIALKICCLIKNS